MQLKTDIATMSGKPGQVNVSKLEVYNDNGGRKNVVSSLYFYFRVHFLNAAYMIYETSDLTQHSLLTTGET